MGYADILVERLNGIVLVTLNRPHRFNAMTTDSFAEVEDVLAEASQNDDDKVVVFTGAGPAFCAGYDVGFLPTAGDDREQLPPRSRPRGVYYLSITSNIIGCTKPTIAAVNGVAAGGGFSFALACDIRIASDQARFSAIWARRGVIPDLGCTYLLPRMVGTGKALELMYTGAVIDAQEALGIGLVNRVVPHQELIPATMELAERIARGPSFSIELTKRLVYRDQEEALLHRTQFEQLVQNRCFETEDAKEGARSFLEHRPPVFKGR